MEKSENVPELNLSDFLQTIDNEITNSISLSESLKGDSLALIATIFALIGIIGISAIKELLLVWVASSFLLITLLFLKILKVFFLSNKKEKNFENFFTSVGEKKSRIVIMQMVSAVTFQNLKPLYQALILIFITDLLIFFLSVAGLVQVADLGFPVLIFIVIVLIILTIFSTNLAKFASASMKILGQIATNDKEQNCEKGLNFYKNSIKASFVLLSIPLIILIFILLKINDVIPFVGNYSNLCKISILMIIQVIFIAIFCEFFNKQMVSQILSKKIALLNSLKLLIFSKDDDLANKIKDQDIKYLFKSCNLFVVQKEPSFFFFEKNCISINIGALHPGEEEELKKLLNDELNYYLTQ